MFFFNRTARQSKIEIVLQGFSSFATVNEKHDYTTNARILFYRLASVEIAHSQYYYSCYYYLF